MKTVDILGLLFALYKYRFIPSMYSVCLEFRQI